LVKITLPQIAQIALSPKITLPARTAQRSKITQPAKIILSSKIAQPIQIAAFQVVYIVIRDIRKNKAENEKH
jgi:hypothetical protein